MKLSYIPLFRWNEKRLAPSRSRIIPNVEQYVQSLDGVGCSEYFGLGFRIQELPVSEIDSSNCNSEVILDGDSTVCDDDGETEDDLPAEEEDIVISKEQIERAVIRVDNIVSITNHILHLGENLRFNTNYVTLLKSALCLLACQENRPSAETMSNLAANLTAYKLEIVSSTDNCLFTVMRNALSEVWTDELQAAFGQLDLLPLQKSRSRAAWRSGWILPIDAQQTGLILRNSSNRICDHLRTNTLRSFGTMQLSTYSCYHLHRNAEFPLDTISSKCSCGFNPAYVHWVRFSWCPVPSYS